jgi:(2Fe-2S) ferredoxin
VEKRLVFVCQNVDCRARKAAEVMEKLQADLAPDPSVEVRSYMCFGACHDGPNVVIYPDKVWYAGVKPEYVSEIVAYLHGADAPARLDTIDPALKEMIFQLLDAGLY